MKEALQQLNERLAGNRFLRGLLTPGGVRLDLDADLARLIEGAIPVTAEALDSLMERIEGNPSIVDRLEDTCLMVAQEDADQSSVRRQKGGQLVDAD